MAADSSAEKIIVLQSAEGDEFKVEKKAAMVIQMINHAIEDDTSSNPVIPIPNISSKTLLKVLEYCTKHAEGTKATDGCPVVPAAPTVPDELKEWDKNFIDGVDLSMLFDVSNAACFLSIPGLVDLACKKIADMVCGKRVEEIRSIFNIENDLTPEEEEQIRRAHPWAFQ